MLLHKFIAGLGDPILKRDVFQNCESFSNGAEIRAYCSLYEVARRDTTVGGKFTREFLSAAGAPEDDVV